MNRVRGIRKQRTSTSGVNSRVLVTVEGPLPGNVTFTRATNATYFDSTGTMTQASSGVARFDYNPSTLAALGLLVEEQRTNLLLNSLLDGTNLSTQNVAVSAVAYTLSFFGTGTVTLSGASAAGPLVGTGATDKVTLTFTPSAGTLTCTVSGTVKWANLEEGSFATSFIPTGGASATRNMDQTYTTDVSWVNEAEGTLVGSWMNNTPVGTNTLQMVFQIGVSGVSNRGHTLSRTTAEAAATQIYDNTPSFQGVSPAVAAAPNIVHKAALAYKTNDSAKSVNGETAVADASVTLPTGMNRVGIGINGSALSFPQNGWIRYVAYYNRRLTNAQIQALST